MPQVKIPLSLFSVQSVKPYAKFGFLSSVPLSQGAWALAWASMSGIPRGATVTSAVVSVVSDRAEATHTLRLRPSNAWSSSTTWANRPSNTASSEVNVGKSSPAAGTVWNFPDVSSWLQPAVSAGRGVYVMLWADYTTKFYIKGSTAATGKAWVTVTYTAAAETPTGLNPSGGAVSVAKPVLTFDGDSDMTALQVQVDPAANGTTPAFDSGTVVSDAGVLDLSTTTYAGLANAATTQWRARVQNPQGWSSWSSWATFSRTDFGAVTISSPTATPDDPTPVLSWSFADQTAWQAFLYNAAGSLRARSPLTAGTAGAWDPQREFNDGDSGSFTLRVYDSVDRDATPGAPEYVETVVPFTVTLVAGLAAPDTLSVSQDGFDPKVTITGTRAAGVPDSYGLYRNDVFVARYDGATVTSGGTFTLVDDTAPMNVPATYAVRAWVGTDKSEKVYAPTITPRCQGIWLIDPAAETRAVLWGADDQDQDQPELSIVHTPIPRKDHLDVEVVRRRLARYLTQGPVSGTLIDVPGCSTTAADSEAALLGWTLQDAGHTYRLVLGNKNISVILGDIKLSESPLNGPNDRMLAVSANYWQRES